jgi:predicted small lipoprotein YifL
VSNLAKTVLIVFAAAAMLSGCGVRGALDAPSAAANGQPAPSPTANADSGQGRPADAPPKPHKSFILDGLI